MAFNINPGKQQFSATASQTVFTFNFAIFVGTDLKVYKTLAGAVANDTTDLLTLSTHYTVSINGTLGGTITLISGASLNDTITAVRSLPITRTTDYVTNGDLYADTLDLDQDYQTYLTLDQQSRWGRSVVLPDTYSGSQIDFPVPSQYKFIRWNLAENGFENIDPSTVLSSSDAAIIANVTDFLSIDTSVYTTAIVKDLNRGGTFIWSATGTANGGTVFAGLTGYWNRQYSGAINVKWFGAVGDGVADDTTAIQTAINSAEKIYIPKGSYKCNVTISGKTAIDGENSYLTKLLPFNTAIAVITYKHTTPYWTYSRTVTNVGFFSALKVGVGVTFGQTNVADYVANDEYANNVVFKNCFFEGFDKGVHFPFGNIGTSFYSCGFSSNKYGVYLLDDKYGTVMHAGNKYFYDGEFHSNDCAIYIHNTTGGFGGVKFEGTIIESNLIAVYHYDIVPPLIPTLFNGCWFEKNGSLKLVGTTTIDQWTGTVLSSQVITNTTMYIDGVSHLAFVSSSSVTGLNIAGSGCIVDIDKSTLSPNATDAGEIYTIASGSRINATNVIKSGTQLNNIKMSSISHCSAFLTIIDSNAINATKRVCFLPYRDKITTGLQSNKVISNTLQTSYTTGGGSFSLVGTVIADGELYPNCNEFTRAAFLSSQYTAFTYTLMPLGYIVLTYAIKATVGAVDTYSWDRGSMQMLGTVRHTAGDGWRTFGGIAYSDGAKSIHPIDFRGTGVDATWRVSALQVMVFAQYSDALEYLNSKVYCQ